MRFWTGYDQLASPTSARRCPAPESPTSFSPTPSQTTSVWRCCLVPRTVPVYSDGASRPRNSPGSYSRTSSRSGWVVALGGVSLAVMPLPAPLGFRAGTCDWSGHGAHGVPVAYVVAAALRTRTAPVWKLELPMPSIGSPRHSWHCLRSTGRSRRRAVRAAPPGASVRAVPRCSSWRFCRDGQPRTRRRRRCSKA